MNALIIYDGGEILCDVRKSDSHSLSSEVATNTLEAGAKISDHVILQPRQLSLVFENVNSNKGLSRATQLWNDIKSLWSGRKLLQVITDHETYSDMVIESVTALQQSPMKGALQFSASFKKINSVELSMVKVPASQLMKDGTYKTASSETNAGVITTVPLLGGAMYLRPQ